MKQFLLGVLCLLLLALAGCTAVNQTNRFVVMPDTGATGTPDVIATPEPTLPPDITPPPAVQLIDPPTETPDATETPAPTDSPALTPTPTGEPEGSPGGFNG